uniref:G_PROTEIN_RECEP_F1_2 domain-containing protein n=1 Tax=Panagrellus redivivus TaxID=6233 RepID=A0A7E4V4L4_PANRE
MSFFLLNTRRTLKYKVTNASVRFFLADFCLGLLLCSTLLTVNWTLILWTCLLDSVGYMEQLLSWIQNTPAGLKLNPELSLVLANFFRYHLHLCRTYVLSWSKYSVIYLPCVAPFIGGTIFIGLFVDYISLITINLRCFHVYSQRLALVSWTAIRSTFYVFQERKWNPLRRRVDYVELDFRQRLFATLQFLFLVSLLPTIAIYCLVFSGLFIVFEAMCRTLIYGVHRFQFRCCGISNSDNQPIWQFIY